MPNSAATPAPGAPDWFSRIPWVTKLAIAYVAVVLGADALQAIDAAWPIDWNRLNWKLPMVFPALAGTLWERFDLFKFTFWLVVPVALSLPGLNWAYLLRGRWTRSDVLFVVGLAILGMAAMFLIPLVPALRAIYPSMGQLSPDQKWAFFLGTMVWNLSWLIGWEFLHRYFLLGAARIPWPRWGWLLVPLSETLYHLQKPGLEALGMCVFSLVLTYWCLKRQNWLLAFLVHLIIEVELLIFMAVIA